MKKKLLLFAMGTALVLGLAACSSSSTTKDKETDTASSDPQLIASQKCSSCHGDQLQGLVGPSLQKTGSKYTKKEILDIIKNGKNNGKMPAGLISGKAADVVAAWLAAKK